MENYCFTLAYNLPSEVEKITKLLYAQNKREDFSHLIVDLGFPLLEGDRIPDNIPEAKLENSRRLKAIADKYRSGYIMMENIGVSQNWTNVYRLLDLNDEDVLIGCDPDEHPLNDGWVKAMGDVIRGGDFGLASLLMTAHIPILKSISASRECEFNGVRALMLPNRSLNWALIGISGRLLNQLKEVPVPIEYSRYGGIEAALYPFLDSSIMGWCVMSDYQVRHTDFELGDPGTSKLLREWKNQIIFNIHQYGQLAFEDYLVMRREGKI